MKLTLAELRKRVQDEHDAYVLLEELRWHGTPICSHCGHDKAYFLRPKNGTSRGTGRKHEDGGRTMSVRRVWKCAKCRKQFSVLTGTVFHGTKVALSDWLTVMVLMCSAKNGISGREVERLIGVTPETAWYMLHRLREAMKRDPLAGMLRGTIVADETWIGGHPKNKHESQRRRDGDRTLVPARPGVDVGNIKTKKTTVLSLVDKTTGEVRSRVIPDVSGHTLRKVMTEQIDYRRIGTEFQAHEYVDHSAGEYVRGVVSTNLAEGYFSQLKRSIDGTHHHVSVEHLPRYLAEFDFRYSTRKLSDANRLQKMIDQAEGRQLTYQRPTRAD